MRQPKHRAFAESVLLAARRNLGQSHFTVKLPKKLWRSFHEYVRAFFLGTPRQDLKIRLSDVMEVSVFFRVCFSLSSCAEEATGVEAPITGGQTTDLLPDNTNLSTLIDTSAVEISNRISERDCEVWR